MYYIKLHYIALYYIALHGNGEKEGIIIVAGDIFPGCSNGFLNGDLSPMHLEEEGYDVSLAPTKALYVAMFHAQ